MPRTFAVTGSYPRPTGRITLRPITALATTPRLRLAGHNPPNKYIHREGASSVKRTRKYA